MNNFELNLVVLSEAKTIDTSIALNFAEAKVFKKFPCSMKERMRIMDIIREQWQQKKINTLADIKKCIADNIKAGK